MWTMQKDIIGKLDVIDLIVLAGLPKEESVLSLRVIVAKDDLNQTNEN